MSNDMILVADKRGNPVRQSPKLAANESTALIRRDRMRYGLQGTSHGGERDYYEILGYPRDPDVDNYAARFERDPMAGTVVEFPATETWRDTPTVKDGKDKEAKEDTDFCTQWTAFVDRLRVYHYCNRVDVLAGIGRFGLLCIGLPGELNSEAPRINSLDDVLYLRPYSEFAASVYQWQTDASNPRFGLPHIYRINVSHMEGSAQTVFGTRQLLVHHSRCIHVAEGLLENEVYGRPRLQRVINLLDDILKVVGGSAEATWKLMRKGFLLNLDPDAQMSDEDVDNLEEQIDEFDHGLRRYMKTRGITVSDLGSQVVDPSGLFDVIVTLLSAATRIPKRILLGSERGELASSQDAANWAGYIAARQLNFAEPTILRPLIDRLIKLGGLPKPSTGRYTVVWDALFEKDDAEKATIAKTWAEAAEKAAAATGGPVISAEEYRGEFTPFAAKLPPELVAARTQAQEVTVPVSGTDVLDQVGDLEAVKAMVANHGYTGAQAAGLVRAVELIVSRGRAA